MRGQLARRMRKLVERLPLVRRALEMTWQAAPGLTGMWLATLVIAGVVPAATVHVTRFLVDSLAGGLQSEAVGESLRWVLALAGLMLLAEGLKALQAWQRTALGLTVEDFFASRIHAAALRLNLAFFESPEFHDRLHQARSDAGSRPMELLESAGAMLQSTITLGAMAVILLRFGVWVPLLLIAATLPGVIAVTRTYLEEHEWRQRVIPDTRRAWYYDWLLTDPQPAAEMRLYGLGSFFHSAYNEVRSRLRGEHLGLAKRRAWTEAAAGLFALAVTAGALLAMVQRTVAGTMSLGELAMFYQAFQQGLGLGAGLLRNTSKIFTSAVFLENLVDVIDLEPTIRDPEKPQSLPDQWDACGVSWRGFPLPADRAPGVVAVQLEDPPRQGRGHFGAERGGQDHAGEAVVPAL